MITIKIQKLPEDVRQDYNRGVFSFIDHISSLGIPQEDIEVEGDL
jgi:hypothetical protein